MRRLLKAALFAAEKHKNGRRKNKSATPYINHPIEVAALLSDVGAVDDTDVLIAALLHDTIEDTDTTEEEIEALFGKRVAQTVVECSDDKSLPKAERKRLQVARAPGKSVSAKLVKVADKICNLQSILDEPPNDWDIERRRNYFFWARDVVAGLRGVSRPLEALFDHVYEQGVEKLKK